MKNKSDIIKQIRGWTKGRTVTKDSLRQYLNQLEGKNKDHEHVVSVTGMPYCPLCGEYHPELIEAVFTK